MTLDNITKNSSIFLSNNFKLNCSLTSNEMKFETSLPYSPLQLKNQTFVPDYPLEIIEVFNTYS